MRNNVSLTLWLSNVLMRKHGLYTQNDNLQTYGTFGDLFGSLGFIAEHYCFTYTAANGDVSKIVRKQLLFVLGNFNHDNCE